VPLFRLYVVTKILIIRWHNLPSKERRQVPVFAPCLRILVGLSYKTSIRNFQAFFTPTRCLAYRPFSGWNLENCPIDQAIKNEIGL